MTLAIMQPYFFPYLGYFQLMHAVDEFVFYDDVNFIKQGWITRNRIIVNNKAHYFNIEVQGASSFKRINEIQLGSNQSRLIKTIEQAYAKAPYFKESFPVIRDILLNDQPDLFGFLRYSLETLAKYLGINTRFKVSSDLEKDNDLLAQDKIIDICRRLGADTYINLIGGQELYERSDFINENISLNFIKSSPMIYPQFSNEFIPSLSIIDLMMFNDLDRIKKMLNQYELV